MEALGIELLEGEIFELRLEGLEPDALRERRIDLHRLLGDPLPLFLVRHVVQRAHVVEAVGELDQEDANVLRQGEQEFAQILGLMGLIGLQLEPAQLGHAVDEPGGVLAEEGR